MEYPEILNLPPKLKPLITEFNNYRFFLIEGGRGSGKSQAVARFLMYLGDQYEDLIMTCGREVQLRIEESVHALFKGLINDYNLNYTVQDQKIKNNETGSVLKFRGFKEQGVTNTRGIESTNILWIDEAQQISSRTMKDLIPTIIRNEKAKLIFTMNRFMRDDAVYDYMYGHPECLHININYFDNPFCPLSMKDEAKRDKIRSEKDYNHIWLGHPLAQMDDYLFNHEKLHKSCDIQAFGEVFQQQRILGIDFAAQGNDLCVATILDRQSSQHWKVTDQIAWDEPDTTVSVGKIINMVGHFKPDVTVLDVGGGGHNVHCDLTAAGLDIKRFDGASTQGIDPKLYANIRSEGYHLTKEWFDKEWLIVPKEYRECIKQLSKIKYKFRNTGARLIQAKVDMKKELGGSPDDADSLMMAIWAATRFLGKSNQTATSGNEVVQRISRSTRRGR